jgi:hypothetical protein
VVANGLGVAALRVPAAAGPELGDRRLRPGEAGGAQGGAGETQARDETELRGLPAAEERHDPIQVVGVHLTAHVGAAQPELAGRPKEMAERPRRVDGKCRAVAGGWHPRAIPELNREGAVGKRPLDAAAQ